MSDYYPDNWVVLKINVPDIPPTYKVLAGWSGGYLDGDSWRMNSGITNVEEKPHHYEFHGRSGSVYCCGRKRYGLRMNNTGIYNKLKKHFGDGVEMLPGDTLWEEVEWQTTKRELQQND